MGKHIVTTALCYANGNLHLGHLLEMIQADIWVRAARRNGLDVVFLSGDDAHGTPIMLQAEKMQVSPEELIKNVHVQRLEDIRAFHISYDCYHTTHSTENEKIVAQLYEQLCQSGVFIEKEIEQAYDVQRQMFLPDRYIKGQCPRCGAQDQYGDNCEKCSATYEPDELVNPYSILTGKAPEKRKTKHQFFNLAACEEKILSWLHDSQLMPSVVNKLKEWMGGLKPWDITRDAPYFGFPIPGRENQYFYVWMDAPIGYIGALEALLPGEAMSTWNDPQSKIIHYIGKDIINFHGLFWPAVLTASGNQAPHELRVHGFMTINGEKMSKSRGTFIEAGHFAKHISTEYLRYYLALKLTPCTDDMDLNLTDFKCRVNGELIGKIINLGNRCMGILKRHFGGQLTQDIDQEVWQFGDDKQKLISDLWVSGKFGHAMREVIELANHANQYVDANQPWSMVKDEATFADAQRVCCTGFHVFSQIMRALAPVLPETFARLQEAVPGFDSSLLPASVIEHYPRLLERITDQQLEELGVVSA